MRRILSLLNKPYPLSEERGAQIKTAAVLGLVVFLFLFIIRPFNMGDTMKEALQSCALAGVIVFGVVMFHVLVLFRLFPRFFREEKWTIGRELLWTPLIIVSIAFANMGVTALMGSFPFSLKNVLTVIGYTAMVGVAPASASILINQMRLLRRYRKAAAQLSLQLHHGDREEGALLTGSTGSLTAIGSLPANKTDQGSLGKDVPGGAGVTGSIADAVPSLIYFTADNGKDEISAMPADLLAVTSADNYCKLFMREGNAVKSCMLRISLKKVEMTLTGHAYFWRCHRTAIVNLAAVNEVSGTAQGYRLHVANLSDTIPVSRSLNAELKKRL